MSRPKRILTICHNDPRLHPGGTEILARTLTQEFRARQGLDARFLAAADTLHRQRRPGTAFQAVCGAADNEMLIWCGHYDRFVHQQVDGLGVFPEFEEMLREYRPDVVHFHHYILLGLEALAVVRRVLPDAAIVLTVHDYYLMCHNDGLMRRPDGRLCHEATPDACTACFPEIGRLGFRLRDLQIRNLLRFVDRFLAPSAFMRDRLVAWGIAPERVEVVRNGHVLPEPVLPRRKSPSERPHTTFATFGNLSPAKGTLTVLDAARHLVKRGLDGFTLYLNGETMFQNEEFKAAVDERLEALGDVVVPLGRYDHSELPARMSRADWVIVPSLWWENAPLTIQEAFHHRRPVICSDIGGMAEAVIEGVSGLQFPAGDALHLASVMERAMTERGLQEELAKNAPEVVPIAACADRHLEVYEDVLAQCRTERGVEHVDG